MDALCSGDVFDLQGLPSTLTIAEDVGLQGRKSVHEGQFKHRNGILAIHQLADYWLLLRLLTESGFVWQKSEEEALREIAGEIYL